MKLPLVPQHIRSLHPYVPGKPIEETQREFGLTEVIKLASNENPLGPSPRALEALQQSLKEQHLYPDASAFRLKQALGVQLGVPTESLCIGNGSNEIIEFLIRVFGEPGDQIIAPEFSFIAYSISAQIQGLTTLKTPIHPETFVPDLSAIEKAIESSPRARLVFLANPNNPTGAYIPFSEMEGFFRRVERHTQGKCLIVLDAAYWEFITKEKLPSPAHLLEKYPHVVTLRTFSKIYGLAGMRVGYSIAHPEVTALLNRVRMPFNVGAAALSAAVAALGDSVFVQDSRDLCQEAHQTWVSCLQDLEIPFLPSQGNFILVNCKQGLGRSGKEVFQHCLKEGVIFRPVENYGLPDWMRISFGTKSENDRAVDVLARLKGGKQ